MIRITCLKPLPLNSFSKINDSYGTDKRLDSYTFKKKVWVRINIACQPFLAAAPGSRPAVNGTYKYDAKGRLGPPKIGFRECAVQQYIPCLL